jgi:hypothetical protein
MPRKEAGRPIPAQGTPDAPGTAEAIPLESLPETRRLVLTDELRRSYDEIHGLSPPEIPDGARVELDLFGEGPAELYAYQLASYMEVEAEIEEIDGLGENIVHILEQTEQGEERSPEETSYWNEIATRLVALVCLADTFTNVTEAQRRLLSLLLETALNELLYRLRQCCIGAYEQQAQWQVIAVSGKLEYVKTLLHEAARIVRELGVEIDQAIKDEIGFTPPDDRSTMPSAIEWRPLCTEMNQTGNADNLLSAMIFATVDMSLDPSTFEYGIFGSTVRALRGIKSSATSTK